MATLKPVITFLDAAIVRDASVYQLCSFLTLYKKPHPHPTLLPLVLNMRKDFFWQFYVIIICLFRDSAVFLTWV